MSCASSGGATAGYFLRRKALESQLMLLVNLQQATMFIDALYEKWSVERQGGEFWTLDSWQECHRIG